MSYVSFISRVIGMSLGVYLRFLPLLIFTIFLFGALYASTSDLTVIYIITFFMLTFGWTYLYLMLLRGGLYALNATTPANADGTTKGVVKLMFVHFLAQLIVIVVVGMATYLFLYRFSLPATAPDAFALMQEGASAFDPRVVAASPATYLMFQVVLTLAAIIVTSLFGAPMAAVAANTAEISPNVDLITGFGRYFVPQFILSGIGVLAPAFISGLYATEIFERIATSSTGGLVLGVGLTVLILFYFAWCIPTCGMALAFVKVREEISEARQVEARPVVNVEEQKQSLRDLRAQRQGGSTTTVYDPNKR